MIGDPVSKIYQTKLCLLPTYCSQSRRCCPGSRSPRHTGRPGECTGPGRRTPTRSTCTATRAGRGRSQSRQFRPRSHRPRHSARSSEHISCLRTETRSVHTNCCRLAVQKKLKILLCSTFLLTAGGFIGAIGAVNVSVTNGGPVDTLSVGTGCLVGGTGGGGAGGGNISCK